MMLADLCHCRVHSRLGRILVLLVALIAVSEDSLAGQLKLSWDAVAGATGYRLHYGPSSGNYASSIDAQNQTSATVSGLTEGVRYYFSVRAYTSTTTSAFSNEVSAIVPASASTSNPFTPGTTVTDGVAVASVAAVSASAQLSGYEPSKAIDGNTDSASRWAAPDNRYPQWLKLDLGAVKMIVKVRTIFYQYQSRDYSYEIQTSVDDASYATVVGSKKSSRTAEWNEDSFSPTSARFVRVKITASSYPDGYAQITEIQVSQQVNAAPVQVNAAPVAAVSASAQLSGYEPSKAIDGNTDSASRWAAPDNRYPQWLKLDLGAVKMIDKVRAIFYQYQSRDYSYEIQTSVDDASYATVVGSKKSSRTADWNEDSFSPTSARFVRVRIAACSNPDGYAQITEIQVSGP